MSDKHYVGLNIVDFEDTGKHHPVSRVTLWVDENNYYTAGDDSGKEISAKCPSATQAIVNALLAQLKGYQYQSFTATDAGLDPAAELGDGITVGGVYATISQINDDGYGYSNVGATDEPETEDEYPYVSPIQQEINRQSTETRSIISKTAEEIRLEVSNELNGLSSSFSVSLDNLEAEISDNINNLSASFSLSLDSIQSQVTGLNGSVSSLQQTASSIQSTVSAQGNRISTVEQTATSLTSTVSAQGSSLSTLEQKVDSFTLAVSNGSTSSTISLLANGVTISSKSISMSGLVTYTGLSSGTTTIDGACIKTGAIDAARLNLTGAITFGDLNSAMQSTINNAASNASSALTTANNAASTASSAYSLADTANDIVGAWKYGSTTYIDGSKLMTGTVYASYLKGGAIEILTAANRVVGVITPTWSSSSSIALQLASDGALRLGALGGNAFLFAGNSPSYAASFVQCSYSENEVSCKGNLVPAGNWYCGTQAEPWYGINTYTEVVVTSDRNKKHEIGYDMSRYDAFFDALKPAHFELDNSPDGRVHLGMVAQDVEDALAECGLDAYDLGALCKTESKNGYDYALRYGEFVAICISQIQGLKTRVTELEGIING